MKRFLIVTLIANLAFILNCKAFAGEESTPPEVPPRVKDTPGPVSIPEPVAEEDDVGSLPPEKTTKKPGKSDCGPAVSDMVEGKCLCPKTVCKPSVKVVTKVVEKPVVKYKTKYVNKPVEKIKYVDKPVEKVVERVVTKEGEFKKWNITGFYGRAPEGYDRTLYKPREGYAEYREYKNYGDVLGISGSYRFTESFNATLMYITNESYLGGVGFNF